MFNKRRQLSSKAALEPRLRCTEVDENGDAVLVDSEFKKSELVARVSKRATYPVYTGASGYLLILSAVWTIAA